MKKLFLLFAVAALLSGCGHEDVYPEVPTLEFKNLGFGEESGLRTVTLTATFTDGDGDIGYYLDRPNDSIFDDIESQYYYNFVISMQMFKNGMWKDTAVISFIDGQDTTFFTENASSRLPYLSQSGQNKGLKGDIDKTTYLPFLLGDSVRFSAFIYDRKLHQSHIIYTPGYFIKYP